MQGRPAEHGAGPQTPGQPPPPLLHKTGATTNLSHLLTPVVKVVLGLTKKPLQPTPTVNGVARPSHAPWTCRPPCCLAVVPRPTSTQTAKKGLVMMMPGHSGSRLLPHPWPGPPEGTRGPPRSESTRVVRGLGTLSPARDGSRSQGETPGHHAGQGEDRKDGGLCPRCRPCPEGQPPARIPAASLRPRLILRSSQAGSCETTTDALLGATGLWE